MLTKQALLGLTAHRLLSPSILPPQGTQLLSLLSSSSSATTTQSKGGAAAAEQAGGGEGRGARLLGPLAPLPPPSPSKLQQSVRDFLVETLGVAPSRVHEEVSSSSSLSSLFSEGQEASLSFLDDKEGMATLALLGYTIDMLLFPCCEGGGKGERGPLAIEVDGPHHFLMVEEGACCVDT